MHRHNINTCMDFTHTLWHHSVRLTCSGTYGRGSDIFHIYIYMMEHCFSFYLLSSALLITMSARPQIAENQPTHITDMVRLGPQDHEQICTSCPAALATSYRTCQGNSCAATKPLARGKHEPCTLHWDRAQGIGGQCQSSPCKPASRDRTTVPYICKIRPACHELGQ